MGQVLELTITVLIELLNRGASTQIEARQIIIEDNKKTLGQLIVQLKKQTRVSPETEEALSTALDARNYIAHEFFLRVTDAYASDDANAAAVLLIKDKLQKIVIGTAITHAFLDALTHHLGVAKSDVLIRQDI